MPGRVDYRDAHDTWHWFRVWPIPGDRRDKTRKIRALCHRHFRGDWSDKVSWLSMSIFVQDDRDAMTLRLHLADAQYEPKAPDRIIL
jgi:hypothetical protein